MLLSFISHFPIAHCLSQILTDAEVMVAPTGPGAASLSIAEEGAEARGEFILYSKRLCAPASKLKNCNSRSRTEIYRED